MVSNSYRDDKNPTSPSETSTSFHEDLISKYREILVQGERKAERARYIAEKIISCVFIIASLVLPYFHSSIRYLPMFEKVQGLVRQIVDMMSAIRPLFHTISPPVLLATTLSLGAWWFYKQGLRWLLSRVLLSLAVKVVTHAVPPPISAIIGARFMPALLEMIIMLARALVVCGIVILACRLAPTIASRPGLLEHRH